MPHLSQFQAWLTIAALSFFVVLMYGTVGVLVYRRIAVRRSKSTPIAWCDYCESWHDGLALHRVNRLQQFNRIGGVR